MEEIKRTNIVIGNSYNCIEFGHIIRYYRNRRIIR